MLIHTREAADTLFHSNIDSTPLEPLHFATPQKVKSSGTDAEFSSYFDTSMGLSSSANDSAGVGHRKQQSWQLSSSTDPMTSSDEYHTVREIVPSVRTENMGVAF